jgi:beta-lactamase regulating signal transducer with metallopeptidase domain
MENFIDNRALPLLLKSSWQAGVLIVLVLALRRGLGRRLNPRWRYGLWLLVAVRLALPWTLPSPVSLFNFHGFSRASEAVVSLRPIPSQSPVVVPDESTPNRMPTPQAATAPDNAPGFAVKYSWLALGWASGAFALALYLAIAHCRLARQIGSSRPLVDSRALNLLEDCKRRMRVRVPVGLVETAAVDGPCLFGFLRPRLLLPAGFTRGFSNDELRFVFLHELGHVKRHDILLGWLMTALQILHWFNPLVWLAFARMRGDRELACDALALSHADERDNQPYGRTIVKLLENFGASLRAPSLAGILEDKQQMKERIVMIANFQKTNRAPVLACFLFIGLGLLTLTDAQPGAQPPAAVATTKTETASAGKKWELEKLKMAQAGNKWAAYDLWDAYYRGKNGVAQDPAKADKWLGEFVKDTWVVRFEPVNEFNPTSPEEFLARVNHYAGAYSDRTKIGESGFFRTTKQGGKLVASFLSNYPDLLKLSLAKVPGVKVTSVEQMTPEKFIQYEQSSQESL